MIISLLLVFIFIKLSSSASSNTTTTATTATTSPTAVSAKDEARIRSEIKERGRFASYLPNILDDICVMDPLLLPGVVKLGLDEYCTNERTDFMNYFRIFGLFRLIENNQSNAIKVYMDPKYKLNFNYYLSDQVLYVDSSNLYDGSSNSFQTRYFTPLMYAVLMNQYDVVKAMVEASFASTSKLALDMPHGKMPLVNARSIARKFFNSSQRIAMLQLLKIDKEKHDMTRVKKNLTGEYSISVKEAVMANSVRIVESALFLGNFGDKNDQHIIRRAMLNENYLILEMLVMEGYAIPDNVKVNIPDYKTMKKKDVDFLFNDKDNRIPLDRRYWGIFDPYNAHAI